MNYLDGRQPIFRLFILLSPRLLSWLAVICWLMDNLLIKLETVKFKSLFFSNSFRIFILQFAVTQ